MFCPKCGTQNPETGKFCRSCGTDLGNVSAVLSGDLGASIRTRTFADMDRKSRRRNDPNEVYANSIRSIISGLGFLIISIALLLTGVAGGHAWWWAMLFPAFTFLSKGISEFLKSKRMERMQMNAPATPFPGAIDQPNINANLPPSRTDYVSPADSRYRTGDLAPPSVTDSTTKLLELDPEGETTTLPKK